jgi:hypothetical protein
MGLLKSLGFGLNDEERRLWDERRAQEKSRRRLSGSSKCPGYGKIWGDLTEAEYKVILFDRHRKVVETMAANLAKATPEQQTDLVRLSVERTYADRPAA